MVHCSGITKITLDDVEYAANAGYVIKLIGSVKKLDDGRVSAIVCPRLVPKSNLLASVDDVYNAISVTGDGSATLCSTDRAQESFLQLQL